MCIYGVGSQIPSHFIVTTLPPLSHPYRALECHLSTTHGDLHWQVPLSEGPTRTGSKGITPTLHLLANLSYSHMLEALNSYLACHPDQNFARYIHSGLLHGFHIGFDRTRTNLRATGRNHPSSLANPAVITSHIANKIRAGCLVLAEGVARHIHISPLGLVPKSRSTNKWRMTVDLSSPVGHSVNDGIDTELTSLAMHPLTTRLIGSYNWAPTHSWLRWI